MLPVDFAALRVQLLRGSHLISSAFVGIPSRPGAMLLACDSPQMERL
jgi:cystathionine beta-lyase family protein involved in aluminum resistance